MLWRLYFGFYILAFLLTVFSDFNSYLEPNYWSLLFFLDSIAKIAGLYSYIFKKHFLNRYDWRTLFWPIAFLYGYLLFSSIFPSYLNDHLYNSLSKTGLTTFSIRAGLFVGSILELPALYALYKLSEGKLSDPYEKPQKKKKK